MADKYYDMDAMQAFYNELKNRVQSGGVLSAGTDLKIDNGIIKVNEAGCVVDSANNAFAAGQGNSASGVGAFAAGQANNVNGLGAAAIGVGNTVSGIDSVLIGLGNCTDSVENYGIGVGNSALSSSNYNFMAGVGNKITSAEGAIAIGCNNNVIGSGSVAIGVSNSAHANYSHAEGFSTIASGTNSHAEGGNTSAYGMASHAEGRSTIANDDYMHAGGRWNKTSSNAAFVIGNGYEEFSQETGEMETIRSDAFVVDWDGNVSANNINASVDARKLTNSPCWQISSKSEYVGLKPGTWGGSSSDSFVYFKLFSGTISAYTSIFANLLWIQGGSVFINEEPIDLKLLINFRNEPSTPTYAGICVETPCNMNWDGDRTPFLKFYYTISDGTITVYIKMKTAGNYQQNLILKNYSCNMYNFNVYKASAISEGSVPTGLVQITSVKRPLYKTGTSSVGNSSLPVYINNIGEPVAINTYAGRILGCTGGSGWTNGTTNYNPIFSVALPTTSTYNRTRFLLVAHPENHGDGPDEIVDVLLGIGATAGQIGSARVNLISVGPTSTDASSLLNTSYFKFGYTWANGIITLWIKCVVDSNGNHRKRFYLLFQNGEAGSLNYKPQNSTSTTVPSGFTEINLTFNGVLRTNNTAVGSSSRPVYINSNGMVSACTYAISTGTGTDANTIYLV